MEFETEIRTQLKVILQESKPFSVEVFFDRLTVVYKENLLFYNLVASKHSLSPIKNECKEILKESLIDSYIQKTKLRRETFTVLAEYIASGILGIYIDWLSNGSKTSLEQLTLLTSELVADDWKKLTGM